ncbi:MAG: stage II sporulation protein R [Oscillospiraceae bacterium]|nr:stage II sporulation protein R [Oscillospiraceae bacterium]MDY5641478.1 stage II sporulation protein R [Candidatus Faecousia sp.]
MKKMVKCVFACALLAAFVWCGTVIADRQRLNEELIRLHVVANSDRVEDQELKLLVRDAIITSLRQALADVRDTEQAKEYLQENLPKLQELANKTLDAAGSAQQAVVTLCREGFPTRQYNTFSLPAGIYEALRVTIGDGAGKNWWCVVFPSLCVPQTSQGFSDTAAGAGFPDALSGALTGEEPYQIRFYLLDKLGELEKFLAG